MLETNVGAVVFRDDGTRLRFLKHFKLRGRRFANPFDFRR
jgi:hypothetical protein